MNKKSKIITIGIAGAIVIFLIVFFSVRSSGSGAIEVRTAKVELRDIKQIISSTGSIEPEARVRISSKIKEMIAEFKFKELDRVEKGDVIVRLDDTAINARLNQARASLVQAQTDLANATIMLRRVKDLFSKDIGSEQDLDDSQMLFDIKKAIVIQQEAVVDAIESELKDTTIVSPISGTIIRKYGEEGEMVGLLTVEVAPIVEIAKLDFFEAHTDVDETDIGQIKNGMKAEVMVDAFPDVTLEGIVNEIAIASFERKETGISYVVKVKITNTKNLQLRLGMTANVNFIVDSKKQTPTVPVWSISQNEEEELIYVVDDNKRLRKKVIKSGITSDEYAEVLAGVEVGQTVVKSSVKDLEDGVKAVVID